LILNKKNITAKHQKRQCLLYLCFIFPFYLIHFTKVEHLNVGVATAYLNQKRLDSEAKNLNVAANNFSKQTQQWLTLIENFSSALKELGDVENWAKTIEKDMRSITAALEIAYKIERE